MATKAQLRQIAENPQHNAPSGVEMMRKIMDGTAKKAPSHTLELIRRDITENCDELLDVGARIRPLLVEGTQIGWVRGVHSSERRRLSRWIPDSNEYITAILTLGTTLTKEDIWDMGSVELRNLVELVRKMSDYDVSLYPYLSAFTSTLTSENLWHGQGTKLTAFDNKEIVLPDGKTMRILVPSEHARLWATLCIYREQAKARVDASWNAILQVRPLAGKSVDPLAAELKVTSRQLATNSIEPWESIIRIKPEVNLNDGWAHSENLETREGMLKELEGMLAHDKHEQLMEKFEKQQIDAAEKRTKAIEDISRRRGLGINDQTIRVVSEAEVLERQKALKLGRVVPVVDREKMEIEKSPVERMQKYK